jgi:cytochrome c553
MFRSIKNLICIAALGLLAGAAQAQDNAASDGAAAPAQKLDVKNLFRNTCGFCHEDYGRKQGKGPKLMDSASTDEALFNRIKKGSPQKGMASFAWLTDDQIKEVVAFIRRLKPDVEPN